MTYDKIKFRKPNGVCVTGTLTAKNNITIDGWVVVCGCKKSTGDKKLSFVVDIGERKAVCESCGATLTIIRTPDEIQKSERKNLRLICVSESYSDNRVIYALSTRLEQHEWNKVKHLFVYFDDEEWCTYYRGWGTMKSEEVKGILKI